MNGPGKEESGERRRHMSHGVVAHARALGELAEAVNESDAGRGVSPAFLYISPDSFCSPLRRFNCESCPCALQGAMFNYPSLILVNGQSIIMSNCLRR